MLISLLKRNRMKNLQAQAIKLGVTGGIGSGKTTVCRVFSVLGIPVFSADAEAKRIMDSDPDLIDKLNSIAGMDLYANGNLDRQQLAKLIFNNRELLEKVNSIVHPLIFENYIKWADEQTSPYTIMEAAILFESGAAELVDRILTVVTPINERIERLMAGNKFTFEQVMERINNQIDDETRIKRSDFIVYNSENDMIIPAILAIHEELLGLLNK
jgi:dephospho-CoA kinase